MFIAQPKSTKLKFKIIIINNYESLKAEMTKLTEAVELQNSNGQLS